MIHKDIRKWKKIYKKKLFKFRYHVNVKIGKLKTAVL